MLASNDDEVFVIRLWQEREVAELSPSPHWRARISYVNNGQHFYASSIDNAFAVVRFLLSEKYQS
ncbi:hypothetical protein [Bradyrhizobium sp. AUGA SZCCT0431]|uniref:hypothetical protein n=1 Tax=Bradyrhizobium sp. AUGA SZCCT0431 TaxID=2807674 RepID=UPI001BAD4F0A|nr:hypothetical protein [Bradyrhizobium sp. AUGA SZCCT0431]MBR1147542.1 hypothetical protein [Bradyrhizobium sp. AUGA SZCCT0431]